MIVSTKAGDRQKELAPSSILYIRMLIAFSINIFLKWVQRAYKDRKGMEWVSEFAKFIDQVLDLSHEEGLLDREYILAVDCSSGVRFPSESFQIPNYQRRR